MDCPNCARKIEGAVRALPGVEDVRVSIASSLMTWTSTRGPRARRRWNGRWRTSATGCRPLTGTTTTTCRRT
nr:cation transporter [Phenylobacterium sp.]